MSLADIFAESGHDDLLLPFQVNPFGLRGRMVRLNSAVNTILSRHDYPEPVSLLLGEVMTIAVCLAGALKYEGVFSLQIKGDGPIRSMVADITSEGHLRGYAAFDAEAATAAAEDGEVTVPRLIGGGYIAFTVDQGEDTERYQGIVPLSGHTLAECTHAYFRQSEQLETGLNIAVRKDEFDVWRAGALMLQRMPLDGGDAPEPGKARPVHDLDAYEDAWRTAMVMLSSASADELAGTRVAPDRLLFRLFHESGIVAYPAQPVVEQCRCSQDRVETVLKSLSPEEVKEMTVDGLVSVTCEFCKSHWEYDEPTLARMREDTAPN
ncbi:Hsp33 family molecular chaperone HslO [Nisaea acidiphila]|uniref:Hsp33 family molecular chaperone HslO n=1 Tax=Nisaea acidiphila TaxID=1862145 RepID=A0A9J7B0D1_9PROT|nr:Hsp33 family molecular chaperone HslO [Nisaea acidiphila]UUX51940.1 Hsp33 family molecular chaperone HslO [Nisaea acidiphila]